MATEWSPIGKLNIGILDNKTATIMDNAEFTRLDLLKHIFVEYHPMQCAIHTL